MPLQNRIGHMPDICCILVLPELLADITRRNAVDQRWHLLSQPNPCITLCLERIDKSNSFFTRHHGPYDGPPRNYFGCFPRKCEFFGPITISCKIMATKTSLEKNFGGMHQSVPSPLEAPPEPPQDLLRNLFRNPFEPKIHSVREKNVFECICT